MSSGSELELGGGNNSTGTSCMGSRLAQLSGLVVPNSSSRMISIPSSPGAAAVSAVAAVVAVANTAGNVYGSLPSLESKFPSPSSGKKINSLDYLQKSIYHLKYDINFLIKSIFIDILKY